MSGVKPTIAHTNTANDELLAAYVIFRHGQRNISFIYPNDPYADEIYWPGGYGQLTNEGKRQLYRLGQYFRSRYNTLIDSKYSPNKTYMQSTDQDRSLVSAQLCLAGLFPPNDEEIWNDNIMWQPIPVHSTPTSFSKSISKHKVALENYMNESLEVRRIYTKYKDLFEHWTKMSGTRISTIGEAHALYKTLTIENGQNKQLANCAKEAIKTNGVMEYITLIKFYVQYDSCLNVLVQILSSL